MNAPTAPWLLLLVTAWAASAAAADSDDAPDAPLGVDGADMPSSLPPIDDELADLLGEEDDAASLPLLSGISLLGHGRMRFELDDSRDRLPVNDLQTGVTLTGRLGVRAPVGAHRATIIIGDGRRFGQDFGLLPQRPSTAVLGFLYTLRLDVDVQALFVPVTLSVGRYPFRVADQRWVGTAGFSARGRTFDGAHLTWRSEIVDVIAGLFYLGPYVAGDVAETSALGTVEVARSADNYDVSLYAFGHRDGTPARAARASVSAGTVGARASATYFGATLALGGDGQLPMLDSEPLSPAGWGAHAEASLRYAPTFARFDVVGTPFVQLAGEWTGGSPVHGRRFRAPGGNAHLYLGTLDLVISDNITSTDLRVGIASDAGLLVEAEARLLFLSDPTGPMIDPAGRALIAEQPGRTDSWALTEVDARIRIPLAPAASLDGEYGVGFPGPAFTGGSTPIQRLLISVVFNLDTSN